MTSPDPTAPNPRSSFPPAPYAPETAAPPHRRRRTWLLALGVIVALVAAGAVSVLLREPDPVPAEQAKANECIQDPEGAKKGPFVTPCDSSDATYKVLAAGSKDCTSVAGTTTIYKDLCLVGTKEDATTAPSSVQVGDCLNVDEAGRTASKSECTSGAYPVLMILTDVDRDTFNLTGSQDPCVQAGVDQSTYQVGYGWSFSRFSAFGIDTSTSYDYVFCLGTPNA